MNMFHLVLFDRQTQWRQREIENRLDSHLNLNLTETRDRNESLDVKIKRYFFSRISMLLVYQWPFTIRLYDAMWTTLFTETDTHKHATPINVKPGTSFNDDGIVIINTLRSFVCCFKCPRAVATAAKTHTTHLQHNHTIYTIHLLHLHLPLHSKYVTPAVRCSQRQKLSNMQFRSDVFGCLCEH